MTYKNAGKIVGMEAARVWYLVHNPVYTGCHVWHRYENHIDQVRRTVVVPKEQYCVRKNGHEPIVSEELFLRLPGVSIPQRQRNVISSMELRNAVIVNGL